MKRLTVVHVNQNLTYVSGYGSREMFTELRRRPPVWSALGRAWCMQPRTARDLIALAESRGYDVAVMHDDPLPASLGVLW